MVKEGDIVTLYANGIALSTGIIDSTDVEVDNEYGEKVTINGRDLMGQLEDQDVVTVQSTPIWFIKSQIKQVVQTIVVGTRIQPTGIKVTANAPTDKWIFAADAGESKLAAFQRFLEGLNCIAWMDPTGNIIVGKPNFSQSPLGSIFLSKENRNANVLSMKCTRQAATIPNVIIPVWTGQQSVAHRFVVQQGVFNHAYGPSRLYEHGHVLSKTVVVSNPNAGDVPNQANEINKINIGAGNLLQLYALRELARENQKEVIIQATVPGHYNDTGQPYKVDTMYNVLFDRGDVNSKMYLYQVQYTLSLDGQRTILSFCNPGTIVAQTQVQ